ncbi:hypothetical protein [Arthrobacter sp. lap29]|uniref:hypothetical protein n=1 Tax=Arthrobacter sp. lap29 TaxID=3056122 RepID=UPI0028F6C9D9|nr:hypothetical protein [Arthrobacter sp. lap29]
MDIFDRDSKLREIITAADRHPDRSDERPHIIPRLEKSLVKVGSLYGRAVEYTPSYGHIEWYESYGSYRIEWFTAIPIKRIKQKD